MIKKKILIAEDEARIARILALELEHEGYETEIAGTGKEAFAAMQKGDFDLVLLDVMLPEISGFEVLRRVRMEDETTPIILVTARDSVYDKVNGLDHGANDYIAKPFEMEELLARVRSAIRTSEAQANKRGSGNIRIVGDLKADLMTRVVLKDNKEVELTKREFDLLVFLMEYKNQILTREQLLDAVWGFAYSGETNVVDVYIGYLRKKLDSKGESSLIHTVRGVGFTMKGTKDEH
ncbi:response regulator transcription factor [Aciduricibacillus chroicocephali]|uniref:Response regulator transcription factor n=1 Tax=Aciduricibacillus chroicocephali TaxID=3054939 RepID=A0ABY9KVK7_9BACI|nr:response regulator transcription factor [Bacillaceae bacterium 44XB]